MNAITMILVMVCFAVGAASIWVGAANVGILFFAVALLVAISGHGAIKAASASTPQGFANPTATETGARPSVGVSNVSYLAVPNPTSDGPVASYAPKSYADIMILKKEFGDEFALLNTGPAIQAQIDALFATASDALAAARASRDADILAKIVPPHFLRSTA